MIEHTDKPFGLNFLTSRNNVGVKAMVRNIPKIVMKNVKMRELSLIHQSMDMKENLGFQGKTIIT